MKIEQRRFALVVPIAVCTLALCTASRAFAGPAGPPVSPIVPWDESEGDEKAGTCDCEDYGSGPDYPTASFGANVLHNGRYPLTLDIQDTSQPSQYSPICCRFWEVLGTDVSFTEARTEFEYTIEKGYARWGVRLTVRTEDGHCSRSNVLVFIAQIPAPSIADLAYLDDLQDFTGLRDIIARHPTRGDFQLGVVINDVVWYDAPMQYNARPCAQNGEDLDRHWDTCPCPWDKCSYCSSDPKSMVLDCGNMPLDNPPVQEYVGHDFNMLATCNSLYPSVTMRKAIRQGTDDFDITRCYAFMLQRAQIAHALDMNAYGSAALIYFLPGWIAYGAATGTLTPGGCADVLLEHVSQVMDHYNDADPTADFRYWTVCNEYLTDGAYVGTPTLSQLASAATYLRLWPAVNSGTNIDAHYWWPWHILSLDGQDPDLPGETLKQAYRNARAQDPDGTLVYCDYNLGLRYKPGSPNAPVDTDKYKAAQRMIDLLQADSVPLDAIGLQTHMTAWFCLIYDDNEEDDMRINPRQLENVQKSIRGFGEKGLQVLISEMDVRIGFPYGDDEEHDNYEYDSLVAHLLGHPGVWTSSSLATRYKWQGRVYEAVLNASLAESALAGICFWDLTDETSWLNLAYDMGAWPFTTNYPHDGSSQPCMFGRNPNTPEGNYEDREMYYPKPAYYGARNAIMNYFGQAFSVKDTSGAELARFVENGNVLLMKEGATVYENRSDESTPSWADILALSGSKFIVRDSANAPVAVISQAGDLYLAGTVQEFQDTPLEPDLSPAFKVLNAAGEVVSLIDSEGNLKMAKDDQRESENDPERPWNGYLLVNGIRWELRENHWGDNYYDF